MKRNKFGAISTTVNGVKFASLGESRRYKALTTLEAIGAISHLKLQQAFVLAPSVVINGRRRPAMKYIADFTYVEGDALIVEDFKGVRTPVYVLKRHLMMSVLGIQIKETGTRK